MKFKCSQCNTTYKVTPLRYKCDCGSPLTLQKNTSHPNIEDTSINSLWRYRTSLPISPDTEIVTLGEGMTPIIALDDAADSKHYVKLDYLCPTGSYKDRGASVLITHLKSLGVNEVVEDSSGNAGAAIAAYCARAGIHCTIYCPESTSESKLKQIAAYGAAIELVTGNRMATTEAVKLAAANTCYASHNWHPAFLEGTKTIAYEIVDQFHGLAPSHVLCPVGFGSIYLGLYIGFREMYDEGIIENVPRLLGVQPETCCPIYRAYNDKTDTISRMPQTGQTLAEGITSELPIRCKMIIDAIHDTNGAFTFVNDSEIKYGKKTLAQKGVYVEPTSAVVIMGYEKFKEEGIIGKNDTTVSILTGSGLKSS